MNNVDFSTYKFRCSELGLLMVNPRSKKEKLSKTTMSALDDIYIREVWGRDKDISSKYLDKGNYTEEDSIDLLYKKYGKLFIKNKEHLSNDFITGTPDIIDDEIYDLKSSWDIWTFRASDGSNKDYFWQGLGYMWLTKRLKFRLAYCLNDTPEHLVVGEQKRAVYGAGQDPESIEGMETMEKVEKNLIFKDIPWEKRIKVFEYDFNADLVEQLKTRIMDAREYLNTVEL
jgi:hypothetical protein